jgi:hypothetical protein
LWLKNTKFRMLPHLTHIARNPSPGTGGYLGKGLRRDALCIRVETSDAAKESSGCGCDEESGGLVVALTSPRTVVELTKHAVGQGTAAGIHDQGIQAAGLTSPHLETYEVTMQA